MTKNEKILYNELMPKSWIAHPGKTLSTNKLKNMIIAEIRLNILRMNDPERIKYMKGDELSIKAHKDYYYEHSTSLAYFLYSNLNLIDYIEYRYILDKLVQAYKKEVQIND